MKKLLIIYNIMANIITIIRIFATFAAIQEGHFIRTK